MFEIFKQGWVVSIHGWRNLQAREFEGWNILWQTPLVAMTGYSIVGRQRGNTADNQRILLNDYNRPGLTSVVPFVRTFRSASISFCNMHAFQLFYLQNRLREV